MGMRAGRRAQLVLRERTWQALLRSELPVVRGVQAKDAEERRVFLPTLVLPVPLPIYQACCSLTLKPFLTLPLGLEWRHTPNNCTKK